MHADDLCGARARLRHYRRRMRQADRLRGVCVTPAVWRLRDSQPVRLQGDDLQGTRRDVRYDHRRLRRNARVRNVPERANLWRRRAQWVRHFSMSTYLVSPG